MPAPPAPGSPVVLFAPASGPGVGGGHIMREGALALALAGRGARGAFAVAEEGEAILRAFYAGALEAHPVARGDIGALAALAQRLGASAVVLDDYTLDAAAEQALAAPARVLMAVDDLADRPHAVDILLDPGVHDRSDPYAGLAPDARRLLGPRYALLRPEFGAATVRPAGGGLAGLFVSFGLSDVDAVACRAVGLIRARAPALPLDVVIASDAASRAALEAQAGTDPHLRLHLDAPDVAALMARADAAVGAGGSGVWERAASGLASLAVVVADNQRALVAALSSQGATLACDLHAPDFEAAFDAAFQRLLDPHRRSVLASTARGLCDGRGAGRVADILLAAIRDRSAARPDPSPCP